MAERGAAFEDRRAIRLLRQGGRYLALVEGLNIHAFGDTPASAVAAAEKSYAELHRFADDMRLPLDSLLVAGLPPRRSFRSVLAALALAVSGFALLMIPFSYAISTALDRAVTHLRAESDGRKFWAGIDEPLAQAAAHNFDLTPEQRLRIAASLHMLVQQIKPMVDELKPLFEEDHAPPSPPR